MLVASIQILSDTRRSFSSDCFNTLTASEVCNSNSYIFSGAGNTFFSVSGTGLSVSGTPANVSRTILSISRTPANVSRTFLSISRTSANVSHTFLSISGTPANVSRTILSISRTFLKCSSGYKYHSEYGLNKQIISVNSYQKFNNHTIHSFSYTNSLVLKYFFIK